LCSVIDMTPRDLYPALISATTAAPSAIDGTRLDGGAAPVLTHSDFTTETEFGDGFAYVSSSTRQTEDPLGPEFAAIGVNAAEGALRDPYNIWLISQTACDLVHTRSAIPHTQFPVRA